VGQDAVADGGVEVRWEARGKGRSVAYSWMYTGEEVGSGVESGSRGECSVGDKALTTESGTLCV
jgi:hypothetical protein